MKTFYGLVTVLFFVVGTPWYAYVIVDDFRHPELWDHDVMHDPRVYLPVLAVVLPLTGLMMWWEAHKLWRIEKQTREVVQRIARDSDRCN